MDKPQILVYIDKSVNYSPFDVKWIPKSAKFVSIGCHPRATGALQVYEMNEGELNLVHEVERPKALKCGTFAASSLESRHLAVGDFDGKLEVLDLTNANKPVYSVQAHSKIINAIDGVAGLDIGKGAPEIATASRDGTVKVWDPRQKNTPVITIEPNDVQEKRDCWAVAFGNAHTDTARMLCAGFDNGDMKVFDLRSMGLHFETNLRNGICCLEFDRKDITKNKLLATTLEAQFCVFDLRTFHEEKGYAETRTHAHNSTVWVGRHLPQNRDIFATGGGNGCLDLWGYRYGKRSREEEGALVGVPGEVFALQSTTLQTQPLTSLDWSRDKTGLLVCSGLDQTLRIVIVTKLNLI